MSLEYLIAVCDATGVVGAVPARALLPVARQPPRLPAATRLPGSTAEAHAGHGAFRVSDLWVQHWAERADALCAARNVAAARAPHPTLMRFDDFAAARTAQLPIAARTAA